ncbi:ROK family protein [Photobacterium makurazakiensis]|uniref:ROK family protein n=1 Tax=Photobacterium makurazakiensis TaxID=2910234 RepID=UPI003D0FCDD7
MLSPIKPLQLELSPGQKKVLSIVRNHAPVSRAKITELSGLRSGSVTSICKELLSMQLISEGERIKVGRGQPIIPLQLSPYAAFSFGVAFHINKIEVALANFCGHLVDTVSFDYQESAPVEDVMEAIQSAILKLIDKHRIQQSRILGLGVSMPGPHLGSGGFIHTIPWLSHWREVDVAQLFGSVFEWPVWIDNDCNVSAVGEYFSGLWPEVANMLLIEIGHGIGGGVIIDGKLFRGRNKNAGEIGTYFSVQEPDVRRPSLRELMTLLADDGHPIDDINDIPSIEHPVVSMWLDDAATQLRPLVLLTLGWFDPDCIVFGGSAPEHISLELIRRIGLDRQWPQFGMDYDMAAIAPSRVGSQLSSLGACMYPVFQTLEIA